MFSSHLMVYIVYLISVWHCIYDINCDQASNVHLLAYRVHAFCEKAIQISKSMFTVYVTHKLM